MTLKHKFSKLALSIAACLLGAAAAQAQDVGLGLTAGTDGIGVQGKVALNKNVMVTGGYNFLDYERDEDYDGVNYDGDLNVSHGYGLLSLHPFANGFNIAGGAYIGERSVDLLASPTGPVEIGDMTFTAAEVGNLRGDADTKSVAPYLGIGFDNFISTDSNWAFNARLGVIFSGEPDVNLVSVGGSLSNNAAFQAELDREIANLEDDIDDFKYYPVASVGLSRKF